MIMILHAVVAEQFLPYFFLFVGVVARFCGFVVDGIYAMGFFSSAVSTLSGSILHTRQDTLGDDVTHMKSGL